MGVGLYIRGGVMSRWWSGCDGMRLDMAQKRK